jgi:hypothetical protein
MKTNTEKSAIRRLPLLFAYRDRVFGNGFVATVVADYGRVLAVLEGEKDVWIYGVRPGGLAGHGRDLAEAHADFRRGFTEVLFDIADEAATFEAFQVEVSRFFDEENLAVGVEWADAVREVRARGLSIEGLPKVSADTPSRILVEAKDVFRATDNALDHEPALAA